MSALTLTATGQYGCSNAVKVLQTKITMKELSVMLVAQT